MLIAVSALESRTSLTDTDLLNAREGHKYENAYQTLKVQIEP
jgi:hypothetical protein